MTARKILGDSGGDDPTWVVVDQGQGPIMVYWHTPENDGDDYLVYWWSIAEDATAELDWVNWKGLASFMGLDKDEKKTMLESGRSPDPVVRATLYADVVSYQSVHNLDDAPHPVSPMEMHFEWPDYVDFPDIDFEEQLFSGGYKGGVTEEPTEDSTGGFRVELRGQEVEITEWTDIEYATGEDAPEGEKVSRQDARVDLEYLLDPKATHRGTYSGDNAKRSFHDIMLLAPEARQKAIVDAAIGYIGYGMNVDESYVDAVGD